MPFSYPLLTVALLAFAGCSALSLAMDRHHDQVCARRASLGPARRWTWRGLGTLLLFGSLTECIAHQGATIGPIAWCGLLTLAAAGVVIALAYCPRRLPLLALGAAGAGLIACVV